MTEVTIEQQTERDAPWNFAVNLLDMIFFTLGMSIISRETVMPLFISSLTDSKIAIGLGAAFFSLGYYLPQLLLANYSEQLRYKKPFVLQLAGWGERGAYLGIALVIWWLTEPAPTLTLVLFLLLLLVSAACSGAATPAWYDMIAKVIPVHRRGIFSGVGHSVGALIAIGGAFVVGWVLQNLPYPQNFAFCFTLALISFFISYAGLILVREPPSTTVKASIPLWRYLRQLPAVLRQNHNYRRFLLARIIMHLGAMATGFFIVYGKETLQIDGATVGWLTAVLVASQAVMNLVWGPLGDRRGYKIVLVCAALCMALAALNAWWTTSVVGLTITFVLLGSAQAADVVSSLNIILEFCAPEDRPTYIGLTNTLLAPVLTLAPILGGWLAGTLGYAPLFLIATTVAGVGCLLMAFAVQEPRRVAGE